MENKDTPRPLTEDQAAEQATLEFLREKYPKMSDEMIDLWARAIANEERDREAGVGERQAEMSSDLKKHVQEAREKAAHALHPFLKEQVMENYREALKSGDFFDAMSLRDEAERLGVDLSEIEKNTPTKLDLEAMKRGEIPLSAIS